MNIHLVIRNEKNMSDFIKLLIYSLKTIDGVRDSGSKLINEMASLNYITNSRSDKPTMINLSSERIK